MKRLILLCVIFSIAITSSICQTTSSTPKVRSEMLVSTAWLAEHLHDSNVVILHVTDDRKDFEKRHIPGARFVPMDRLTYSDGASGTMGMIEKDLPSVDKLQKLFSELGVADGSHVILYATNWFPNAARGYFTLDYLGHGDKTSLLDGGMEQWLNEKRPVESGESKSTHTNFTPHVHPEVLALLEDVKKMTEEKTASGHALIVDSRPHKRYTDGHLTGAVSLYWKDTLVSEKSPLLLPPEKLRQMLTARGIAPGVKIVTYCEVGLQASHGYFLAKYLGYDAAMYDGSIHEWDMINNLPLAKGESKK